MQRGLSLYLDTLRLIAAVEVALFHLDSFVLLGGERAWWNAYGHEAVVIFFVLSGFVIRHAAEHRDSNLRNFAISRITRVYSVAIPCLLLTWLFDQIGQRVAPEVYAGLMTDGPAIVRLLMAGTMLNETALASVQVFSNTPYWSIAYEFWYYFLFGAIFFLNGWRRIALLLLVALIAGPRVLLLFPIWAFGWAAYVVVTRCNAPPRALSWALFLLPLPVLLMIEATDMVDWAHHAIARVIGESGWRNGLAWSRYVVTDTLLGASVALHLIGAAGIAPVLWRALHRLARPIRFGAARSFTLYLLHQPAMLLCGALLLRAPLSAGRPWLIGACTLAIVAVVAELTESQRNRLRPIVARIVDLLARPLSRAHAA
jgi:peptidoglycan/LPS O-acetylase OafA/YrhL